MPLSAPEYWLEWTKNYFRCQFTHVGELIHKETWSAASFGWAEGLQTINPPIYRLTTAVSDIDQTNINRDIRDGNWLSSEELSEKVEEAERPSASLCSRSLTAKEERKETEVKLETIVLSLKIKFFS